MAERSAGSIRARVRAEMTEEIKKTARRHLASDGANLSLRAVARDIGVVSSALYRYFPSRDDLLTALIVDAYNALGEAAEKAEAGVADRRDFAGRWLAVARAVRGWALARPHEYALIYGSPVPGYAAPPDTIAPATRVVLVLGTILADAYAAGAVPPPVHPVRLPAALRAELRRIGDAIATGVDERVLARALMAWTELLGAVSFELYGHLTNVFDERTAWFEYQMRTMIRFIGLAE
jgi:AcrR family transcriptional regulator